MVSESPPRNRTMTTLPTQGLLPPAGDPEKGNCLKTDDEATLGNGNWPAVPGYQILGELGQGGMGIVYKARQAGLNRLVALKMIRPGAKITPNQLARFHTEAKAVAQIQHPHIVQIHEIGEHEGKPYFSMEFVAGSSLHEKLNGQPLKPHVAARLIEVLARAMQEVHRHGIVHRDLKPGNILLTETGSPKIADFGLARRLDRSEALTMQGEVMGSPSYMAPEQVRGEVEKMGPAVDIYALGAMLYTVLTGRAPFEGDSITVLWATIHDAPESPRQFRPQVPPALEAICLKCLEKDPSNRFQSAEELAEALHQFRQALHSEDTEASTSAPPPPTRKPTKPQTRPPTRSGSRVTVRRRKTRSRRPYLVALVLVLILVPLVWFGITQFHRPEPEDKPSEEHRAPLVVLPPPPHPIPGPGPGRPFPPPGYPPPR